MFFDGFEWFYTPSLSSPPLPDFIGFNDFEKHKFRVSFHREHESTLTFFVFSLEEYRMRYVYVDEDPYFNEACMHVSDQFYIMQQIYSW
jgi:hypothetical protein